VKRINKTLNKEIILAKEAEAVFMVGEVVEAL